MDYIWTSMIIMKPRNITVPYTSPFQPMETPTRHSFDQVTRRENPLRKLSWRKIKTAGIFLFNRNITPTPSIQPRPGDPTFPHPGIQPASTVRSQKCRKGSRRDSGIGPSLHEERSPTSPTGEKEEEDADSTHTDDPLRGCLVHQAYLCGHPKEEEGKERPPP